MAREWCRRELDTFAGRRRGEDERTLRRHIIIVGKNHVPPDRRPPLLQGQEGYNFFALDGAAAAGDGTTYATSRPRAYGPQPLVDNRFRRRDLLGGRPVTQTARRLRRWQTDQLCRLHFEGRGQVLHRLIAFLRQRRTPPADSSRTSAR
jgi:hypothetical protein